MARHLVHPFLFSFTGNLANAKWYLLPNYKWDYDKLIQKLGRTFRNFTHSIRSDSGAGETTRRFQELIASEFLRIERYLRAPSKCSLTETSFSATIPTV